MNFASLLTFIAMTSFEVKGHGRLMEPASRASAWRKGFNTPTNYDDNQLFCGGSDVSYICIKLSVRFVSSFIVHKY